MNYADKAKLAVSVLSEQSEDEFQGYLISDFRSSFPA